MAPKLISMLTHNDVTVKNALDIFTKCRDVPCEFWGFKDIGLPEKEVKQLVDVMKEAGKTTFLEIVSLKEQECMAGATLAIKCKFDYLIGTLFHPKVFEYLNDKPIRFMPFAGKVTGHPSIIKGTIKEIIEDGNRLKRIGADGIDLLAYRYVGDPEQLAREFISAVDLPVIIAGSINSFNLLDKVIDMNPWAFTIGTAFFEKKFASGDFFGAQVQSVLDYLEKE